jgi:hypothetical protein
MVDAADKEYQRQYDEKNQVAQLMLQSGTDKIDTKALAEVNSDILAAKAKGDYGTREELIDQLSWLYPEIPKSKIADNVYAIIPDIKTETTTAPTGIKTGGKLPTVDWKALGIPESGIKLTETGEAAKEQWWK